VKNLNIPRFPSLSNPNIDKPMTFSIFRSTLKSPAGLARELKYFWLILRYVEGECKNLEVKWGRELRERAGLVIALYLPRENRWPPIYRGEK